MSRPNQNAQAIMLMIAAIFLLTIMDTSAKALSHITGPLPAIWARYTGQASLVLIMVAPRLQTVARTHYPRMQLARSVFLMIGTSCFFFGIANIGLAEATAIMNLNPVLITLGAALFLQEKIGVRRAIGIVVSLCAAMIIIRPGSDVFTPYALFPVVAALSYSCYALATRFVGRKEDPWTSLLYTALFGAVIMTIAVPFFWKDPGLAGWALMAVLAVVGTISQLFLIKAFSMGEAGMLAPFSYVGLIFATIWGMVFFGEYPDHWTIVGGAIIALAGIYVWYRETFVKPPPKTKP